MSVNKEDLGVDPLTNVRVFKVTDAATGEVIGYDYVAPDAE
jgi:hypothetical protein